MNKLSLLARSEISKEVLGKERLRELLNKVGRTISPSRSLSEQNSITRMTGRSIGNFNISGTADTATLTEVNMTIANIGDRIVNFGDMFQYWRMTGLRVFSSVSPGAYVNISTALEGRVADGYFHAIAFVPLSNADFGVATNQLTMVDFPEYTQSNGAHNLSIRVDRSGLIGSMMTDWLATNTTVDGSLQSAGTITALSISPKGTNETNVGVQRIWIEFSCEFCVPTDTTLLPSLKWRSATNLEPSRQVEFYPDGKSKILKSSSVKLLPPEERKSSSWF